MHKAIPVCFALFATLVTPLSAPAEILGPGEYHGVFGETRWGQKVFFTGPYHLFVADSALEPLAKQRGKPVAIKVTELSQPENPGAGLIQKVETVTASPVGAGLALSLKIDDKAPREGKGVLLRATVVNTSDKPVEINENNLGVIFAAASVSVCRSDKWYYRYTYRARFGLPGLSMNCQEQPVQETAVPAELAGGSASITVIQPGKKLDITRTLGKDLLPGEYEAYFCLQTGNFSHAAGPTSARVSFDVIKPADAGSAK